MIEFNLFETICLIIALIGLGMSGIILYYTYDSPYQKSCVDGYFFKNTTKPRFAYGDWVCVNIKGMKYERAVEVCNHEVGHEIFAEVCEKNMTKCFDVTD